MDIVERVSAAPAARPAGPGRLPFGGLGFDLCGLGRTCVRLPLQPPAAPAQEKSAPSGRA